jgi:hypothetical protein
MIQGIRNLGYCNMQTPLAKNKVELAINQARQKYPQHEVIIVTQPGDYKIDYPYRCICSNDENYDLYLLCNADVLILSRSTFSLSAAFLGTAVSGVAATVARLPTWACARFAAESPAAESQEVPSLYSS